jgi:major membrane immunogen (membrane-anchored lipoprotein)
MNMRMVLTGGAIAAALLLGACHKSDATATNEVNAATELSNMADTNANDEMMNEDMGNQAATNAD